MLNETKIEWTKNPDGTPGATWNFIRGCRKISPGCKFCYAETFAERFRGVPGNAYEQGFDFREVPQKLGAPFRMSRPTTIFVNSMSDFFYDEVSDEYLEVACRVMEATPWHTYQILTKRSGRMKALLNGRFARYGQMSHIWWGTSVEDKKYGVPRIWDLRAAQAAVRFLSVEPLLEDLGKLNLAGIHWVIVGGESGAGCREMRPEWATKVRDQCLAAAVPFFFKQWGGYPKAKYGRVLEGQTWDQIPDRPLVPIASQRERQRLEREILSL